MINFRFLVNTKNLKIHARVQPSLLFGVWINIVFNRGQLLNGSVNRFAIQCQFLTVANSDTNGFRNGFRSLNRS